MTKIQTLSVAAAALVLAAGGAAAAQTPYGGYPGPAPTQTGPAGVVGALLGALFGTPSGAGPTGAYGSEAALDAGWARGRRPLAERRADLDLRLDAGVRDGSLSRYDADRLRTDYDGLVQLEARYGADGRFTASERAELRSRYRAFVDRYQSGGYDDGDDRWRPLAESRAAFETRLDAAVRSRILTRTEAARLSSDFNALEALETRYARDGIDARERQDLEARWAELNRRVGDDYDDDYGSGGGYGSGDYGRQIADIEARIAAGERSGAVARLEAERLRTELGDLTRLEAAYRDNGFNADERAYLSRRFGELDARVRLYRR